MLNNFRFHQAVLFAMVSWFLARANAKISNSYLREEKVNAIDGSGDEKDGFGLTSVDPSPGDSVTTIPNEIVKRIEEKPAVNSAIDAILVLVVIQTMLGLGCTMDISLIKEHLYHPNSKLDCVFNSLCSPVLPVS